MQARETDVNMTEQLRDEETWAGHSGRRDGEWLSSCGGRMDEGHEFSF
jgi:hypothetical protein